MKPLDYKSFYDKVGKANGWDFSKLKLVSEGAKWDFNEEIMKRSKASDILLDIGTGGGENVLNLAPSLFLLVGIDISVGMMKTAQSNLLKSEVLNVRFSHMSSEHLLFPTDFFDLVSCRHAPFSSTEVDRVIKKGGYFLTQQVGEGDKLNVKKAFNRGNVVEEYGALKKRYVQELKEVGFSEVQSFEYNSTDYFQRPEDIIFLLKHTPTIPNFGQEKTDFEILDDFIKNNRTEKGIRTNSKRFLIVAKK
ncbi:SAM-dependent methyltransferase [Salipaludibacillus neizhouensis]|uniref:SAM-dependent methyltransferase n=1 Tax=Salipaludibacillus neizhouensis TaxID=885475 RepID=A0A3A9K663_9BACI|nr:class I SAM-dependent methyltransferase [Salipaludibacillus neizhouensis]RKL65183.1 SAM-dependent methyltransferase [Salipaludibacillus neizhouensis]